MIEETAKDLRWQGKSSSLNNLVKSRGKFKCFGRFTAQMLSDMKFEMEDFNTKFVEGLFGV